VKNSDQPCCAFPALERVERIERQQRRNFLLLAAQGFLLMSLIGHQLLRNGDTLRANAMELRNGVLTPQLAFYDQQQRVRLAMGIKADGDPYLAFVDRGGTPRLALSLDDTQAPALIVVDEANGGARLLCRLTACE
jgi:hypothetical protein